MFQKHFVIAVISAQSFDFTTVTRSFQGILNPPWSTIVYKYSYSIL